MKVRTVFAAGGHGSGGSRHGLAVVLLGAAFASAACESTSPKMAASVAVLAPADSLEEGATLQLAASVRDGAGQELPGRPVAWSSSDTLVLRVSATGLATGVAPGTAIASATADGRTGSLSISVKAAIASVDVLAPADSLVEGSTLQVTVSVRDARGHELTGRAVIWSLSDTSVLRPAGAGLFMGVAPGRAVIHATAGGKTDSLAVRVVAAVVASVRLAPASAAVLVGDTVRFTATPYSAAGAPLAGRVPQFECDDPGVATVSSDGVATGVAAGMTMITARYGTASGSARVGVACALRGTVGYTVPAAYAPPAGPACTANDVPSLGVCAAQLRLGTVDLLRIDALIPCSGPGTCLVDLSGISRPVTVFGSRPDYGLWRADSFGYPLILMVGSSRITIANLTLDDGPDAPACDPIQRGQDYDQPCSSSIVLDTSSQIVLDRLTLLNAKTHAVQVMRVHGFILRNSTIANAGTFGVWVGAGSNLLLENDYIHDVRSNGIYLSNTDSATIRLSTIRHNHRVALFNLCDGLCPGGQIDIVNNSHLTIASNEIVLGQIDLNNANGDVCGIEINDRQSDVLIDNNFIAYNKVTAITANPGAALSNFVVSRNKVVNNGLPFWFEGTQPVLTANCFTP